MLFKLAASTKSYAIWPGCSIYANSVFQQETVVPNGRVSQQAEASAYTACDSPPCSALNLRVDPSPRRLLSYRQRVRHSMCQKTSAITWPFWQISWWEVCTVRVVCTANLRGDSNKCAWVRASWGEMLLLTVTCLWKKRNSLVLSPRKTYL